MSPRKSSLDPFAAPKKPRVRKPKVEAPPELEPEIDIPPIELEPDNDGPEFNPTPHFYRTIALSFLGLAIVLVAAVVYLTSGRAVINLTLKSRPIKVDQLIGVAPKITANNQISGWIGETLVKGEKVFTVSGGKEMPSVATGRVVIYNKSGTAQPLVATTRLQTKDGILCRLTHTVTVPAHGQIEAEMYADKPGSEFELPPSQFTIPGLSEARQKLVYAESQIKMTGGVKNISTLTEDDIKRASEQLAAELTQRGQEILQTQVNATSSYTAKLFSSAVNSTKSDKKAGEETSDFKVSEEVKVTGIFYEPAAVSKILAKGLQANLQEEETILGEPSPPAVLISKIDAKAGVAELRLTQEATALVDYTSGLLDKSKILGQKAEAVKSYLSSLPWVEKMSVVISPSWVKKVPKEMEKVEIKVNEE